MKKVLMITMLISVLCLASCGNTESKHDEWTDDFNTFMDKLEDESETQEVEATQEVIDKSEVK